MVMVFMVSDDGGLLAILQGAGILNLMLMEILSIMQVLLSKGGISIGMIKL